jgi:hypothetical protein
VDNGHVIDNTSAASGDAGSHRKGRSSLRLLCIGLLMLASIAGCSLPQAPGTLQWDTHLTIPLGVRTYGLSELVDTSLASRQTGSGVGMDSDSILYFASFQNLKLSIDDSLFIAADEWRLVKPAFMSDTTGRFTIPRQRHRLLRAMISTGTATITIHNDTPGETDSITIVVTNLASSVGDTLVIRRFVSDTTTVDTINLHNYFLTLADTDPQYALIRMHTRAGIAVTATLQTSRLSFSYYNGVLDSLVVPSEPDGDRIEHLPTGWDAVHPTRVDLRAHFVRGITGAIADMTASVHTLSDSSTVPLDSALFTVRGVPLGRDTTVVFTGLDHMVHPYPDSVFASGTSTLSGRISSYGHDTLQVNLELHAPLCFTMDSLHSPGDAMKFTIDDLKDIQQGSATIRVWNRLPVAGHAFLVAARDSSAVLANSGQVVDTVARIDIPVAPLHNGRATDQAYTEFTIPLSDSVLAWLKSPPFFTRTEVNLPASSDTVLAHAGDWVKVQIIADVHYHVSTGGGD